MDQETLLKISNKTLEDTVDALKINNAINDDVMKVWGYCIAMTAPNNDKELMFCDIVLDYAKQFYKLRSDVSR